MNLPSVSIIFPIFNGGKQPLECLMSISRLNYPKNKLEVIVVDNGSTDQSTVQIEKQFPKTILLKNKTNLGFAKAVNIGIRASSSDFILITNDDVIFDKNSLKNLATATSKTIGALGGSVREKNRVSLGYRMNHWTGAIYPVNKTEANIDWIPGCALLVPKKVIKRLGGLDECFSHFFEDVDLCLRIKLNGYKLVSIPEAKFFHKGSKTADKNKPKKYYQWYKNKFRFILKNLPIYNILSILFLQLFLITPYRAIFLGDSMFYLAIKGFFWNMLNFSQTIHARNSR